MTIQFSFTSHVPSSAFSNWKQDVEQHPPKEPSFLHRAPSRMQRFSRDSMAGIADEMAKVALMAIARMIVRNFIFKFVSICCGLEVEAM